MPKGTRCQVENVPKGTKAEMSTGNRKREMKVRVDDSTRDRFVGACFARGAFSQQEALMEAITMWMEHVGEVYGSVKIEPPSERLPARRASGE